ncbi:hypothetical protein LX32DRAFT_397784 [Colletotrichum zoysiae]|uniref:Uncharacterized protein n=1 Tax=Colletotrichum zoysiae TaxID=1216348 RepID=A0AAD9HSK9_9PEZI|nr:hypothetical protein LX32DRAFT_397784 [Colletotrichum zoysiae]
MRRAAEFPTSPFTATVSVVYLPFWGGPHLCSSRLPAMDHPRGARLLRGAGICRSAQVLHGPLEGMENGTERGPSKGYALDKGTDRWQGQGGNQNQDTGGLRDFGGTRVECEKTGETFFRVDSELLH